MISQTDATLSPAATTTTTTNLSSANPPRSNTTTTTNVHNGKSSKGFTPAKKRKKFDETIIDGFAIIGFKTWEDLQDELNERSSSNNNNITPTTTTNSTTTTTATANNNDNNNKNFDTNCTADKQKSNSKSRQKSSSTSSTSSGNSEISLSNASNANHNSAPIKDGTKNKKKDKAKKIAGHSEANSKDKRNKTSSEKTTLKMALEAKELAEKRLSILQEKLKQEQTRNRNHNNVNNKTTSAFVSDHYNSNPRSPTRMTAKDDIHSKANGMLGQDLLKDPNLAAPPKATSYSPFHINSQLHRPNSAIHHQVQSTPPPPQRIVQTQTQTQHQQQQHPKHPPHPLQHHNQSQQPTPPPTTHLHHPQQSTPPPLIHQSQPQYSRQPHIDISQSNPHPHLLQPTMHPLQPPMHPYPHPHQPPSSMMSPMGLGSLPSPYSCPPSIYITDTISRQTSIIPPPLPPALDQSAPPTNRFGHSSVLHQVTPYNPAVPSHHPMYYPTLPTERSFIEFARSYTGPSHLGYPSLLNTFPTPSPGITANPYSFDRWPRVALDHQRAVSRYNSLYQSTTVLPDRTYASYTTTRPPTYPAGLFPPPF